MKLQALVVMLLICLSGCALHSEPKDNQEFYGITQLSELDGVYKNKGEPSGHLSAIIWGNIELDINPAASHEDIEFIEVSSTEDSLIVKAVKSGCTIYERSYILEEDFNISEGIIIMHSDTSLLTRGAGDVLVGPSYENITLGLDSEKHGKYRRTGYAAGLVFLFLPIAISDTSDVRFERVNDKPQRYNACSNR